MTKQIKKKQELDRASSIKKAEAVLDEILRDYKGPEEIIGENGLLKQLTKSLIERVMRRELTHHLGYEKHDPSGRHIANSRNGSSSKTIYSSSGKIGIDAARDRKGSFEPQIIPKHQKHFRGFDDKIISMYARGMTTREISAHLREIYQVDVSAELISHVTEEVICEVREWQSRPLDEVYPIVYFDALFVNVRDDGRVRKKAVYTAIGVNMEGYKEVLGLWIAESEGAKFWLKVVAELKSRGVKDILIACVDGLTGFPEAIHTEFPQTQIQLCIVHMVRNSLKFVSWKDRKQVAKDLKEIYQAASKEEASSALEDFQAKWEKRYPMIGKKWSEKWELLTPFLSYPPEIRKAVYTTNAIESLNMSLRKIIKTRSSFPNDEAALKLLYLALRNASKKWSRPIHNWSLALQQFSILFDGRIPIN